jgi:hypothetical protein
MSNETIPSEGQDKPDDSDIFSLPAPHRAKIQALPLDLVDQIFEQLDADENSQPKLEHPEK